MGACGYQKQFWPSESGARSSRETPSCLGSRAATVKADAVRCTSQGEVHTVSSSEGISTTFHDPDIVCKKNHVEHDGHGSNDQAEEKRQRYFSPGLFMRTAWCVGCHRFVMIVWLAGPSRCSGMIMDRWHGCKRWHTGVRTPIGCWWLFVHVLFGCDRIPDEHLRHWQWVCQEANCFRSLWVYLHKNYLGIYTCFLQRSLRPH